jgi:hypothetical protein
MEHDTGKVFIGCLFTMTQVADIVILAKDTAEIAVGKKDRTGTAASNQRRFLAEMG